jgi:hypothetical protein
MLIFMQHTGIEARLYTREARPPAAVAAIGIIPAAACCLAGKRHGPLFFFVLFVTKTRCHTWRGVSSLKLQVSSLKSGDCRAKQSQLPEAGHRGGVSIADCGLRIEQNEANFARAPGNGRGLPGPRGPAGQQLRETKPIREEFQV